MTSQVKTYSQAIAFSFPFSWAYLFLGLSLYVVCYLTWPSKRRGNREGDNGFLDLLELVLEFPVEFVLWIFRQAWRLVRGLFSAKGEGFDIDI